MILIGAALYLMGVVLLVEEISLQPYAVWHFFCARSCCLSVAILLAVVFGLIENELGLLIKRGKLNRGDEWLTVKKKNDIRLKGSSNFGIELK
jgi:hypothetical protein